eukprot:g1266.t1
MDSWLKLPTNDKNKLAERERVAGLNCIRQFNFGDAEGHLRESLKLSEECGNKLVRSRALCGIGRVHAFLGRFEEAIANTEEAVEMYREINKPKLEAEALSRLVSYYEHTKQLDLAIGSAKRWLWLEEDPTKTEPLQHRIESLETLHMSKDTFWPAPPLSLLADEEIQKRVEYMEASRAAIVHFLKQRANAEATYADALRRCVSSAKCPSASEGVANTIKGIMYEGTTLDAEEHDKIGALLYERASELERLSTTRMKRVKESSDWYRRARGAATSARSVATRAKEQWTVALEDEDHIHSALETWKSRFAARGGACKDGGVDGTDSSSSNNNGVGGESDGGDEDVERRYAGEKRKLQSAERRVEIATSAKSVADEKSKQARQVARVAKVRLANALLHADVERLNRVLGVFKRLVTLSRDASKRMADRCTRYDRLMSAVRSESDIRTYIYNQPPSFQRATEEDAQSNSAVGANAKPSGRTIVGGKKETMSANASTPASNGWKRRSYLRSTPGRRENDGTERRATQLSVAVIRHIFDNDDDDDDSSEKKADEVEGGAASVNDSSRNVVEAVGALFESRRRSDRTPSKPSAGDAPFSKLFETAIGRKVFVRELNRQRSSRKEVKTVEKFDTLIHLLFLFLDAALASRDVRAVSMIMIMSQTFYIVRKKDKSKVELVKGDEDEGGIACDSRTASPGGGREFLQVHISRHRVWKEISYWEEAFLVALRDETLKNCEAFVRGMDAKAAKHCAYVRRNYVFGQLASSILNMVNFGIPSMLTKSLVLNMSISYSLSEDMTRALIQQVDSTANSMPEKRWLRVVDLARGREIVVHFEDGNSLGVKLANARIDGKIEKTTLRVVVVEVQECSAAKGVPVGSYVRAVGEWDAANKGVEDVIGQVRRMNANHAGPKLSIKFAAI